MASTWDFDALRRKLSPEGAVCLPGDAGYEEGIKRWSDTCEKRALAVVQPACAEDVSKTVEFLASNGIDFTTVCAGHSTSGSSAISDGVVINLRAKMRSVTVDTVAKTIAAQGGCNWQDVDEAGMKYGLATPGGTVNHTGIGGLTLGGGFGWLSPAYGLTCDNLVSATVVLADGRIVKTSADNEPDLFWAIRGAGQCFGVCTEFVYQGHDQRKDVWAGIVIFTPDKIPQVVSFVNKLVPANPTDSAITWGFSAPPPMNVPVLLAVLFHNGPEEKGKEIFKDIIDAGPVVNTTQMIPYEQVNGLLNESSGYGGRKLFGGTNVKLPLTPDAVQAIFDEFTRISMDPAFGANESLFLFETLPNAKTNSVPLEATAYANRGDYYSCGLLWKWAKAEDDQTFREFNRHVAEFVRRTAGTTKAQDVGQYANYVGVEEKSEKVFGVNTARLRALKGRYDPNNRFNKWHKLLSN